MAKHLPTGRRVMDVGWLRDENGIVHTGEALVLACLLKVKKGKKRTTEDEAELKRVLRVKEK